MPRYLILDVETCALAEAGTWLAPVKAPSNYKKPEAIAAYIAEATVERDDKLALDPDCNRIVAIGYNVVGSGDPVCDVCVDEGKEKIALSLFWSIYTSVPDTRIVSFYGRQFDLPVIMRRSMYLGIPYPKLNLDRYRSQHLDVWDALTYNGALRTAHSLSFYQKRFGLPTLDKVDGGDIGKLVAAGDWDAIKNHCLSDVGLCHALANKLGLLEL